MLALAGGALAPCAGICAPAAGAWGIAAVLFTLLAGIFSSADLVLVEILALDLDSVFIGSFWTVSF